jgi:Homeodomain
MFLVYFCRYFIKNPHPDDKAREELSLDLGLEPSQVKFWFQNKRTQLKVCVLLACVVECVWSDHSSSKEGQFFFPIFKLIFVLRPDHQSFLLYDITILTYKFWFDYFCK